MLQHLTIRNYALIETVDLSFTAGFTVITGETGSGKSVLLGALGLVLGNRADTSVQRSSHEKTVVEATFSKAEGAFHTFLVEHDLDVEESCLLRREITPSGKSRAFINDTPVKLSQLKEAASLLLDIHGQDETQLINQGSFQLQVVDALANNGSQLISYTDAYHAWKKAEQELEHLRSEEARLRQDEDYLQFQWNELEEASLNPGEWEQLEKEQQQLEHADDIQHVLEASMQLLQESETNIVGSLRQVGQQLRSLQNFNASYGEWSERLESVRIELEDIASELEREQGSVLNDPNRLEAVRDRLDVLNRLAVKHRASTDEELMQVQQRLADQLEGIGSVSIQIEELTQRVAEKQDELVKLAGALREKRLNGIPSLERSVQELLTELGLEKAVFEVHLHEYPDLHATGIDEVEFRFSANTGMSVRELSKVASGGERSRLMLILKYVLSQHIDMPTLIFDEIDTGVSGQVAGKLAHVLKRMSQHLQVFSITHLPQVAGLGDIHFRVAKFEEGAQTISEVKQLTEEERLDELAAMLSGLEKSEAALKNARELLKGAG